MLVLFRCPIRKTTWIKRVTKIFLNKFLHNLLSFQQWKIIRRSTRCCHWKFAQATSYTNQFKPKLKLLLWQITIRHSAAKLETKNDQTRNAEWVRLFIIKTKRNWCDLFAHVWFCVVPVDLLGKNILILPIRNNFTRNKIYLLLVSKNI